MPSVNRRIHFDIIFVDIVVVVSNWTDGCGPFSPRSAAPTSRRLRCTFIFPPAHAPRHLSPRDRVILSLAQGPSGTQREARSVPDDTVRVAWSSQAKNCALGARLCCAHSVCATRLSRETSMGLPRVREIDSRYGQIIRLLSRP